mgnify:CR=1 FL=1
MKVDVSVIIPIYNSEKYLGVCLDSVIKQDVNSQVILVDDGSKDNSKKICQEYTKKFSNVLVLSQNNLGPAMARNLALKKAIGEYIYFIDSDDYLEPHEIKKLLIRARLYDLDAIIGGYKRVNKDGKIIYRKVYKCKNFKGEKVQKELIPQILGSSPQGHDNIRVTVWNVLFRKNIIDRFDIKFLDVKAEDTIFNIDFYSHAREVAILDTSGYCYRENPFSMTSSSYKKDLFAQSKKSFFIQKKRLIQYDIYEISKLRLFRQFFVDTRESLRREVTSISGKNKKDALKSIKKIISDRLLLEIINSYPVNQLEYKQRIFLKLIKFGNTRLIYLLINLYNLENG